MEDKQMEGLQGTNSVSEMTPEQVNRRLFDLTGWTIRDIPAALHTDRIVGVYNPHGELVHDIRGSRVFFGDSDTDWYDAAYNAALKRGKVPHWTGDPGAALALCLEIQRGLLVEGYALPDFEISQDVETEMVYASIGNWEGEAPIHDPALALSRLALDALRARANGGAS